MAQQVAGISEFAGHLKAELLSVRYGLERKQITETEAQRRVAAIRRRRELGQAELLQVPQAQGGMFEGRAS